jgi:hypothetical protein
MFLSKTLRMFSGLMCIAFTFTTVAHSAPSLYQSNPSVKMNLTQAQCLAPMPLAEQLLMRMTESPRTATVDAFIASLKGRGVNVDTVERLLAEQDSYGTLVVNNLLRVALYEARYFVATDQAEKSSILEELKSLHEEKGIDDLVRQEAERVRVLIEFVEGVAHSEAVIAEVVERSLDEVNDVEQEKPGRGSIELNSFLAPALLGGSLMPSFNLAPGVITLVLLGAGFVFLVQHAFFEILEFFKPRYTSAEKARMAQISDEISRAKERSDAATIESFFNDENPAIRQFAVNMRKELSHDTDVEHLQKILMLHKSLEVSLYAIRELILHQGFAVDNALISILEDNEIDWRVHRIILPEIAKRRIYNALPAVLPFLSDSLNDMRRASYKTIDTLGLLTTEHVLTRLRADVINGYNVLYAQSMIDAILEEQRNIHSLLTQFEAFQRKVENNQNIPYYQRQEIMNALQILSGKSSKAMALTLPDDKVDHRVSAGASQQPFIHDVRDPNDKLFEMKDVDPSLPLIAWCNSFSCIEVSYIDETMLDVLFTSPHPAVRRVAIEWIRSNAPDYYKEIYARMYVSFPEVFIPPVEYAGLTLPEMLEQILAMKQDEYVRPALQLDESVTEHSLFTPMASFYPYNQENVDHAVTTLKADYEDASFVVMPNQTTRSMYALESVYRDIITFDSSATVHPLIAIGTLHHANIHRVLLDEKLLPEILEDFDTEKAHRFSSALKRSTVLRDAIALLGELRYMYIKSDASDRENGFAPGATWSAAIKTLNRSGNNRRQLSLLLNTYAQGAGEYHETVLSAVRTIADFRASMWSHGSKSDSDITDSEMLEIVRSLERRVMKAKDMDETIVAIHHKVLDAQNDALKRTYIEGTRPKAIVYHGSVSLDSENEMLQAILAKGERVFEIVETQKIRQLYQWQQTSSGIERVLLDDPEVRSLNGAITKVKAVSRGFDISIVSYSDRELIEIEHKNVLRFSTERANEMFQLAFEGMILPYLLLDEKDLKKECEGAGRLFIHGNSSLWRLNPHYVATHGVDLLSAYEHVKSAITNAIREAVLTRAIQIAA